VLATLLAVALLLAPEQVAITWDAPATCPDAEYLRERIAQHLRGVEVEAAVVRAQVLAPAGEGAPWRLRIAIGDEGQRELEGASCAALADAAAVMVAISLNAAVAGDDADVPEPPVPAPTDDVPPAQPAAEMVEAATLDPPEPLATRPSAAPSTSPEPASRPRRSPPQAVLGVTTGVHGVGLPAPGAQLGGRVGLRWGPLSAAVTGTHWFRRERPVVGDIAASYQLTTGGLDLCGVLPLGRDPAAFELLACVEAEAGVLRAEGLRASPSRIQHHPWAAVGGGAGAAWIARSWLAVGLRANIVAPVIGRRFFVGDVSAGAVGPVDARGTLVLELRLPTIVAAR
jgi:hypothetical protein